MQAPTHVDKVLDEVYALYASASESADKDLADILGSLTPAERREMRLEHERRIAFRRSHPHVPLSLVLD